MIAYVKGILSEYTEDGIVVEAGGIGYAIAVPTRLLAELPENGSEVKLYTYFQVAEDAEKLFGFGSREEKKLFQLLLKVSGIGPKSALSILSVMDPDALRIAVVTGDVKGLSRVPGLGKKTAEKLILELKDKIDPAELGGAALSGTPHAPTVVSDVFSDVVEALQALGYGSAEAMKAVRALNLPGDASFDEVMQEALRILSPF